MSALEDVLEAALDESLPAGVRRGSAYAVLAELDRVPGIAAAGLSARCVRRIALHVLDGAR